jgi:hypothetical protein
MTVSDIMKKKLETIEGMASVQQTAKKYKYEIRGAHASESARSRST